MYAIALGLTLNLRLSRPYMRARDFVFLGSIVSMQPSKRLRRTYRPCRDFRTVNVDIDLGFYQ
jgi:hypothetical protein